MAVTAQYTAQPILEYAQGITADTSRTNPTNSVEITAGPNVAAGVGVGKRINRIVIHATSTTTNGMVRFWLSLDSGTTKRLILEKGVAAITASGTLSAFRAEVPELVGLILPGGTANKLYVSTQNTETFNIIVESALL